MQARRLRGHGVRRVRLRGGAADGADADAVLLDTAGRGGVVEL